MFIKLNFLQICFFNYIFKELYGLGTRRKLVRTGKGDSIFFTNLFFKSIFKELNGPGTWRNWVRPGKGDQLGPDSASSSQPSSISNSPLHPQGKTTPQTGINLLPEIVSIVVYPYKAHLTSQAVEDFLYGRAGRHHAWKRSTLEEKKWCHLIIFGLANPAYTGCGPGDEFGRTWSFLRTLWAGGTVPIDSVGAGVEEL
jgi:hypothetical protein